MGLNLSRRLALWKQKCEVGHPLVGVKGCVERHQSKIALGDARIQVDYQSFHLLQ